MDGAGETLCRRAADILSRWGLPPQVPELLKYRENAVFRVRLADGDKAALRLHRPGYHDDAALRSELEWMADLERQGLAVPRPLPASTGELLVSFVTEGGEIQYADLIGWVEGAEIGHSGTPLTRGAEELAGIYTAVGRAMAGMHDAADRWTLPPDFERPVWDAEGLLGETPFWGRFWDCPGLATEDRRFLGDLRERLRQRLPVAAGNLDYGLIHADLVRENVLVAGGNVAFIDFDDCGFGWRLFDIATVLIRNRSEPHFALIRRSLLEGYRSRRVLDERALSHLPLFMLLRGLTYIGWIGERPDIPDAAERMGRYVAEARVLATELEEA